MTLKHAVKLRRFDLRLVRLHKCKQQFQAKRTTRRVGKANVENECEN